MKLLFINYEFPPLGGGGGRANAQIAKHMASLGHEVRVVTSSFRGLPARETKDGYEIIRIPSLRKHREKCRVYEMLAFLFSSLYYGLKIAREFQPQRCIAFFTLPSAPAAYLIKVFLKIPYIVSLRGGDVPGFMAEDLWLYHRLTLAPIRHLWKNALAVVANSNGLKELAMRSGKNNDILMIPNGVDSNFFDPDTSKLNQEYNPSKSMVRLLSVGRLSTQKSLDTLIRALAKVKTQTDHSVQLSLVGDGPEANNLKALVKKYHLENDVIFHGWQEPEAIKNYYASSDIFILPSLDEGMPNAVLEAMSMGLPIIASKVSGTDELVHEGQNGLLFDPKNEDLLALHILRLVNSSEQRKKMSARSLELISQFDWSNVAKGYLKLCSTAA